MRPRPQNNQTTHQIQHEYNILLVISVSHYLIIIFLPFSCANLLASIKVTSLSLSKSFLLPTKTMTILGLAKVRASVNQFVSALYVSRLENERWLQNVQTIC